MDWYNSRTKKAEPNTAKITSAAAASTLQQPSSTAGSSIPRPSTSTAPPPALRPPSSSGIAAPGMLSARPDQLQSRVEALTKELKQKEYQHDTLTTNYNNKTKQYEEMKRSFDETQRKLNFEMEKTAKIETTLNKKIEELRQYGFKMSNMETQLHNMTEKHKVEQQNSRKLQINTDKLLNQCQQMAGDHERMVEEKKVHDRRLKQLETELLTIGRESKSGLVNPRPVTPSSLSSTSTSGVGRDLLRRKDLEIEELTAKCNQMSRELAEAKGAPHQPPLLSGSGVAALLQDPTISTQPIQTTGHGTRESPPRHNASSATGGAALSDHERSEFRTQLTRLENELETIRKKLSKAENSALQAENDRTAAVKARERAIEDAQQKARDHAAEIKDLIRSHETRCDLSKEELAKARKEAAEERRELLSRLEHSVSESAAREKAVKGLGEEKESLLFALENLKNKIAASDKERNEVLEDLRRQLMAAQCEVESKSVDLAAVRKENEAMSRAHEALLHRCEANEQLLLQNQGIEHHLDAEKPLDPIPKMTTEEEEETLSVLRTSLADARRELENRLEIYQRVETERDAATMESQSTREALTLARVEIETLEQARRVFEEKCAALQTERQSATERVEQCERERQSATERVEECERQMEQASVELERIQASRSDELETLIQDLEMKTQKMNALDGAMKQLELRLESAESDEKETKSRLEESEDVRERLLRDLNEAKERMREHEEKAWKAEETIRELSANHEEARQVQARMADELTVAGTELRQRDKTMAELNEHLQIVVHAKDSVTERCETLEQEIENARRVNEESDRAIAELTKQCRALTSAGDEQQRRFEVLLAEWENVKNAAAEAELDANLRLEEVARSLDEERIRHEKVQSELGCMESRANAAEEGSKCKDADIENLRSQLEIATSELEATIARFAVETDALRSKMGETEADADRRVASVRVVEERLEDALEEIRHRDIENAGLVKALTDETNVRKETTMQLESVSAEAKTGTLVMAELRTEISELRDRCARLQDEMDAVKVMHDVARTAESEAKDALVASKELAQSKEEKIETLRSQVSSLTLAMNKADDELRTCVAQLEECKEEFDAVSEKRFMLEEECRKERERATTMAEQIKVLESLLEVSEEEKLNSLAGLETHVSRLAALDADLHDAREECLQLKTSEVTLRLEVDSLKAELEAVSQDIHSVSANTRKQSRERDLTKVKAEAALKAAREHLAESVADLTRQKELNNTLAEELETVHARCNEYRESLERALSEEERLRAGKDTYDLEIEDLKRKLTESEGLFQEAKDDLAVQADLTKEATAQVATLQTELEEARAAEREQAEAVQCLDEELATVRDECAAIKDSAHESKEHYREMAARDQTEIDRLEALVRTHEQTCSEVSAAADNRVELLIQELESANEHLDCATAELAQTSSKLQDAQAVILQLRQGVAREEECRQQAEELIVKCETRISELENQREEHDRILENLRGDLAEANAHALLLKNAIESLEHAVEESRSQLTESVARAGALESELIDSEERRQRSEENLSRAHGRVQDLSTELVQSRFENDAFRRKASDSRDEIERLKEEVAATALDCGNMIAKTEALKTLLENTRETKDAELANRDGQIEELTRQIQEFQKITDGIEKERDEIRSKLTALRETESRLRMEMERQTADDSETEERLQRNLDETVALLGEAEAARDRLERVCKELTANLTRAEQRIGTLEDSMAEIPKVHTAALGDAESVRTQLAAERDAAVEETMNIRSKLTETWNRLAELSSAKESTDTELKASKEFAERTEREREDVLRERDLTIEKLESQLSETQMALDAMRTSQLSIPEIVEKLTARLESAEKTRDELLEEQDRAIKAAATVTMRVSELEAVVEALEAEKRITEQRFRNTQVELEDASARLTNSIEELNVAKSNSSRLSDRVQEMTEANVELEREKSRVKEIAVRANEEASARILELEAELTTTTEVNQKSREKLWEAQSLLQEREAALRDLESEIDDRENAVCRVTGETALLKAQLDSETQRAEKLEDSLAQSRELAERLSEERDSLVLETNKLRTEIEAAQIAEQDALVDLLALRTSGTEKNLEIESLVGKRIELQQALDEADERALVSESRACDLVAELQDVISEMEKSRTQLAELKEERSEWTDSLRRKEIELDSMRIEHAGTLDAVSKDAVNWQETAERANAALEGLRTETEGSESQFLQQISDFERTVADREESIRELQAASEVLKERYQEVQENLESEISARICAEKERKDAAAQLDVLSLTMTAQEENFSKTECKLTHQIECQTESLRQCEARLEQVMVEFEKCGEDLEGAKNSLKDTREELDATSLKLAEAETRVNKSQARIEELSEIEMSSRTRFEIELGKAAEQVDVLSLTINVKEDECSKTERELTERIECQAESLKQCEAMLKTAKEDFKQHVEELEEARNSLKETRKDLDETTLRLNEAEKRADEQRTHVEELNTKLQLQEAIFDAKEKTLSELTAAVEMLSVDAGGLRKLADDENARAVALGTELQKANDNLAACETKVIILEKENENLKRIAEEKAAAVDCMSILYSEEKEAMQAESEAALKRLAAAESRFEHELADTAALQMETQEFKKIAQDAACKISELEVGLDEQRQAFEQVSEQLAQLDAAVRAMEEEKRGLISDLERAHMEKDDAHRLVEEETQHALEKEKELEVVMAERKCNLAMIVKHEETIITLRRDLETIRQEHEISLADRESRINADVKTSETKLLQAEQIIQIKGNQIRNLENDVRDHQNRISDLNKSVDTLQTELDEKKRLLYDSSSTKDQILKLELQVRDLTMKSAAMQDEKKILAEADAIKDAEMARLKLEMEGLERQRVGLMEQIAEYEETIAQQKNNLIDEARRMTMEAISQLPGDVLQAERIRGLEEEIFSLKCTVQKMEDAVLSNNAREGGNQHEDEEQTFSCGSEDTERGLRQELESARAEFDRERGLLETELLECRSLLDRKEKELVDALEQSKADGYSEHVVLKMEEKLEAMELNVRSLEAEIERKQSTVLEHEKRTEEMKMELGQHERHYKLHQSNLEKTMATLEEKERLLQHHKSQADHEQERAETLHKELVRLQADFVSLQMRMEDQMTEFEQRTRENEAEKDCIQAKATQLLNEAVEAGSKKDEQLLCLENQLIRERETAAEKVEATVNESKRREEEFGSVVSSSEVARTEMRLADYETELRLLKEAMKDRERDVSDLTQARKQLESDVKAKEERIHDLESQLSVSSDEVSRTKLRVETELQALKETLKVGEGDVSDLIQTHKQLESDVKAKEQRIHNLELQLSVSSAEVSQTEKRFADFETELRSLKDALKDREGDVADLTQALKQIELDAKAKEEQIRDLESQLSRMEEQMRIATTEHEETDDRLLNSLRENRKLQMKVELYKKKVGQMRGGNNDDATSTLSLASADSPRSPLEMVAGNSSFKSTPTLSDGEPVDISVPSQGWTRSSGRLSARSETTIGSVEPGSKQKSPPLRSAKRPAVGVASHEEVQNAKKLDVRSSPLKRREEGLEAGKKRTPLHEHDNNSRREMRKVEKERGSREGKKEGENQCAQQ